MKKIKEKFEVEIDNIKVTRGMFYFDYVIRQNGKWIKDDTYSSSHSRHPSTMRSALKRGFAIELAFQGLYW